MTARPDPWQDDKLGRKQEASDLLRFLSGRVEERRARHAPASYVLSLDSQWGQGKTYFLTRLRDDLRNGGVAVAFVNAWETDFSDDPLTAIMSAVDDGLKPFLGNQTVKKAWQAAVRSGGALAISLTKNVAGKLVSKYAGDIASDVFDATFDAAQGTQAKDDGDDDAFGVEKAIEEMVDKLADSALQRLLTAFRTQQRSIVTFKAQLAKVAKSLQRSGSPFRPIYVLIDELDRCRPLYAIRVLEAVKHLFDTDGVVFIVATDTEQLAESVKAIYGANFDSNRYLYRFFDRTYRFRQPDSGDFVGYLYSRYNIPLDKLAFPTELGAQVYALRLFEDFGVSLRGMEQCFDMLQTVCTLWDKRIQLELGYLLALIILYHSGRLDEYGRLSGRISGPFEHPLISTPSTLMSRLVGGYNEPAQTVTGTTKDLLDAYKNALDKTLVDYASQNIPTKPVTQWVAERMRAEFSMLHNNMSYPSKPTYSVIREYHQYVELAVRFEKEEQPAAE